MGDQVRDARRERLARYTTVPEVEREELDRAIALQRPRPPSFDVRTT
jgi:hypothetical protein